MGSVDHLSGLVHGDMANALHELVLYIFFLETDASDIFILGMQAALLKEYPNRMLVTVTQCVFGTVQTLVAAAVAERDIARWKIRLDITLVTILYSVMTIGLL